MPFWGENTYNFFLIQTGCGYLKPCGTVFVWAFGHLHCWIWGASASAEGQHKCHHRVTPWPVQGSAGQRVGKCIKREFCDAVAGDSRVSTTVTQNSPFTHGCSYFWCQDVNKPFFKPQLKPSNTLVSAGADSKSNLCFWATLPLWEALLTVMNVTHQNALI